MRFAQICTLLVSGTLLASPVLAEETPIHIDTDLSGDYFIVERAGTEQQPIVTVKNAGPGFSHFIKREFDCQAHSFRYLAEGDSLQGMAEIDPKPDMEAVSPGSIPDQLLGYVCPKDEKKPDPAAE